MPEIRASSVQVAKTWHAHCRLPGCGWEGSPRGTYAEANDDRFAHLDEHRREASRDA